MNAASFRLLPLALGLAVAARAQSPALPSPTEQTREMSARLHLNEGQFVKLLILNRTRQTRQREIEQATPRDLAARTSQLTELQAQYELECARIMSPTQLSQLQQDENQTTTSAGNG
jgi:hypothetical protein